MSKKTNISIFYYTFAPQKNLLHVPPATNYPIMRRPLQLSYGICPCFGAGHAFLAVATGIYGMLCIFIFFFFFFLLLFL